MTDPLAEAIGVDRDADSSRGASWPRQRSHRQRILVVDDDADVREEIAAALRDAGYLVTTATNGDEALRLMAHEYTLGGGAVPHLIIVDYLMPVMNGLEFYRQVRNNPKYAAVHEHIVALSSAENLAKLPWVLSIAKPFDLEELLETVAREARQGP